MVAVVFVTGTDVGGTLDEPALLDADDDAAGAAFWVVVGDATAGVVVGVATVVGTSAADGTGGVMP